MIQPAVRPKIECEFKWNEAETCKSISMLQYHSTIKSKRGLLYFILLSTSLSGSAKIYLGRLSSIGVVCTTRAEAL
jgi:hypothetical protein